MYEYLLFYYDDYYPHGGMEDCVLKTNSYVDMMQYIYEHYDGEYYQGTISYYDTFEDKIRYADIEEYYDENYFTKFRFVKWED